MLPFAVLPSKTKRGIHADVAAVASGAERRDRRRGREEMGRAGGGGRREKEKGSERLDTFISGRSFKELTQKSSLFIISYISAFNVCSSAAVSATDLLAHLCLRGELRWPTLQVLSRSALRSREYTHESVRIRSEQDP